jgi:hypothetical protein
VSAWSIAMKKVPLAAVLAATVLTAAPRAQLFQDGPRPSQLGSVTQHINETKVTLEYSRPVARGRVLFGELVPWGKIWTPGANDATTIALTTDVKVNGEALPKGTYTVWSVPEAARWTIVFNSEHPVFHNRYDTVAQKDVLRVQTTPRQGLHMETLAWYFPVVDGRKAELVAHWGTTVVPIEIQVP